MPFNLNINKLKYIGIFLIGAIIALVIYGLTSSMVNLFKENKDNKIGRLEVVVDDITNVNDDIITTILKDNNLSNTTNDILYNYYKDNKAVDTIKKDIVKKKVKTPKIVYHEKIKVVINNNNNKVINKKIEKPPDIVTVDINVTEYKNFGKENIDMIFDMYNVVKEYK